MTEIAHGVKHLAVIMDGNGRWAKNQGFPRIDGHLQGAQVAMDIVESCVQKNIFCKHIKIVYSTRMQSKRAIIPLQYKYRRNIKWGG